MNEELGIDGRVNSKLTSPLKAASYEYVEGPRVLEVWRDVLPLIEKAAVHGRGEYQPEDVLVAIHEGRMQLWLFREEGKLALVCVTEIISFPRKTVCFINALAGYRMLEMWDLFFPVAEVWLAQLGVSRVMTECRDEVAAKTERLGFRKLANVMAIDLED